MPKKLKLEDLKITQIPVITIIGCNHEKGCAYPTTKNENDCKCVKYYHIRGVANERYRVSSGTIRSWEKARLQIPRLIVQLSPGTREKQKITHITIEEVLDLYIKVKENAQDPKKLAEYGPNPAIGKFRTIKF